MCPSLLSNKVAGLRPPTLLKMRLWHRCFPVNFAKFLRTIIVGKGGHRSPFLDQPLPLSRNPRCSHLSQVYQKNKSKTLVTNLYIISTLTVS